jgi:hypothetical protein
MATLGSSVLTLADAAKRQDPGGKSATIAELLNLTNEILDDMPWKEGNLLTGERTTVRTGLPTVAWRLINNGVTPSKSTTVQIDEATGRLEAWSEVDEALAEIQPNLGEFRLSEATPFLEAMSQEFAATLFYGNSDSAPEEFTGLAPRFSDSSGPANAQNIVDGSGSGSDNSSIWLIVWGQNSIFGIYPKSTKAGLMHKDLGLQVVETTAGIAGNRMLAYRDQFVWNCGIALKDWRYVVRIANIDISNLVAKSSAADLYDLMIKAMHRIPNMSAGRAVFYMNRSCRQMLDIQGRDDIISGGGLTFENKDGKLIPHFRGIPVKICDSLTETESQVS